MAVRMRNKRIEERFWDAATDELTAMHLLIPPFKDGIYSAAEPTFDADGEPANETISEVPFYLPHAGDRYTQASENPYSGTDPDYAEDWEVAGFFEVPRDRKGQGILADFEQEPGEAYYRMIVYREVTAAGGYPSTQDQYFSGAWAVQFLRKYTLARAETFVVDVGVDALDIADYTVGNPSDGLTYLSRAWMVFERRHEPAVERTLLRMRSLVGSAEDVSSGALPTEPVELYPPVDPTVTCECVSDEFKIDVSWSAPGPGATPAKYELQRWSWYESEWTAAYFDTGTSTSFTLTPPSGTIERGAVHLRIRSVDSDGIVSDWFGFRVSCPECGSGGTNSQSGDCFEIALFSGTISAGSSSVWVAPTRPMSVDLDTAGLSFIITSADSPLDAVELHIGTIEEYRFQVVAASASGPPVADVSFYGQITRFRSEDDDCDPCWRKDTWHKNTSACAPFAQPPTSVTPERPMMAYDPGGGANKEIYACYGHNFTTGRDTHQFVRKYTLPDTGGGGNTYSNVAIHPSNYEGDSLALEPTSAFSNAIVGSKIYIAGGLGLDVGSADPLTLDTRVWLRSYDIATDTWAKLADMPSKRMYGYMVYDGSGKLYYIGGSEDAAVITIHDDIFEYDISGDSWSSLTTIPENLVYMTAVFQGGEIVLFGGQNAGGSVSTVRGYDLSTWSTYTSLAEPLRYVQVAALNSAVVMLIQGQADPAPGPTTYNHRWNFNDDLNTLPLVKPTGNTFGIGSGCIVDGLFYSLSQGTLYVYVPYEGALNPFTGEAAI
jgi:hypothetical protein